MSPLSHMAEALHSWEFISENTRFIVWPSSTLPDTWAKAEAAKERKRKYILGSESTLCPFELQKEREIKAKSNGGQAARDSFFMPDLLMCSPDKTLLLANSQQVSTVYGLHLGEIGHRVWVPLFESWDCFLPLICDGDKLSLLRLKPGLMQTSEAIREHNQNLSTTRNWLSTAFPLLWWECLFLSYNSCHETVDYFS